MKQEYDFSEAEQRTFYCGTNAGPCVIKRPSASTGLRYDYDNTNKELAEWVGVERLQRIHELAETQDSVLLKTVDAYFTVAQTTQPPKHASSKEGDIVPRMTLDLSVEQLAQTIADLSEEERETLALLLSEHGEELKRRKQEIEQGTVTGVREADIFDG